MDKPKKSVNIVIVFIGVLSALVIINLLFIFLTLNESKTMSLLKNEMILLNQEKQIINASADITQRYQSQINVISNVFPNEETIPQFIQTLEAVIRAVSDDYSFKFNSLTPLPEQDNLYLLINISMKTTYPKFTDFLNKLEHLPYLIHVTAVNSNMTTGFIGAGNISLGLKVYVQNPFSTK